MDRVLVEGEFAEGAYGPTILLRTSSHEGAELLRSIFERMAQGEPGMILSLEEQAGVALSASLWALRLIRVPTAQPKRLSRDGDGGFTWVGNQEEWETTALLVGPLTQHTGHQYLTSEQVDDALIEVSQGEVLQ